MQQYLDMLRVIINQGNSHNDRTQVGTTSIFGYQTRYNLEDGFPLLTTKKLSFKWIAEELFWFLSGSTNVDDLRSRGNSPITIWDEWATSEKCAKHGFPEGELGPIYGHCWRNFGATKIKDGNGRKYYDTVGKRFINYGYHNDGADQINNITNQLRTNPRSRRLIISGWDPSECDNVELPPCHTLFQLKWHEETNRLDGQLYQRSADSFLGVPYNIASYSLLTILLASAAGMLPGHFIHTFGDLHIYNNHYNQVQEQLSRSPKKLPILNVNKNIKDILDFTYDDLQLTGYDPYPSIKAEVAV